VPVLALSTVRDGVVIRPLRRETEPRHVWAITRPSVAGSIPVAATMKALRLAVTEHERATSGRAARPRSG
jgi:hypothetical protein